MSRIAMLLVTVLVSATVSCASAPTPTPASTPAAASSATLVTADGIIQPIRSADLAFQVGGRVATVNVNIGDRVKKGDVLAKLDDTAIQKQIAQAETVVALAQKQLDQLQTGASVAERAAAQAALDAAQRNYDKVRAGPTADELAQLKAQADNAKALRDQAQAAYDRIGGASNPDIGMTPESAQLQQAINNYNAADAAYRDATTHPTAAELAAAQAQLDQAKAAVARLDPTNDALDLARLQVQNAQAALDVAKANALEYTLTASFDGIIGQKNITAGDVVVPGNPTPAFTLGDVSKLRLETTNLAEVDAPKIQIGQSADVTLDAFPGQTFRGKVSQIAPSATEHRGDRVFTVWIDLGEGTDTGLRWGMSATARITDK
ncbi:MAG: HlyD family secretion protein [Acidobacteriota bacterium]